MNKNYINFHCHSSMSNISTPDSTISNRDRAMRVLELGQSVLSSVEHGWAGRIIETIELAKEFNVKPLLGVESYFVKNRLEKDKTNAHLILLAKNENGRKSINRILSEANVSGFYYKPRIDLELLLSLPKNDVWISSACIGGVWRYEDYENLIINFHNHFQENFFLEVQNHNVDSQKYWNTRILDLSHKHNIPIIAGMDSHMIYPTQAKERDDYILSRGISYPDEENWYLDFPSYEDAVKRFEAQGVLNKNQIEECLENTNIFNEVQEYNSIVFNPDIIKLPSLYADKTQEQKNQILKNIIQDRWNNEKNEIPPENWKHYEEEIEKELNIVFETKMSDYFLLDYEIVKRGIELGGQITLTGRGSAPSFFLSKLLGFTTIDRISANVKLFPERFISSERLLETRSLPDIDLNLGNPEVFAEAQRQIMGDGHSYPMIAFGTVKDAGAWKLYSRISDIDFETANKVSEQIQKYEMDLKHIESDEEKESLNILDYIDRKYHSVYNESRKYLGLVNSVTPHPCAHLIFNHSDIREEFGLIKIKTGNVEHICACCDGLFAENYKLLKNDLLKVAVVKLIHETYNRIGIKPHSISELLKLCNDNQNVWDVYANGWTKGINQFEQSGTRGRATKYKPKNISELSAFVAAIRPGFKSNYSLFESRQPFEYGVKSLDKLIQTPEFPYSFMLYQENAMQVMAYSGIPISKTYEIIKNIAKKRVEKVKKYKDKFVSGMKKRLINDENIGIKESENIANMTWQIIDDSSHYSFNACISGNTVIDRAGRHNNQFNPTIQEMFLIKNDLNYAKKTNHIDLHAKYNQNGYGNALSMFEDGRIRKNKIVDIYQSGIRDTYNIMTENGASIVCTDNHKFPTPNGNKQLKELSIGDTVYVKSIYEKTPDKHRFTDGNFERNVPKKGQMGFQKNENGASVIYLKTRSEKIENNIPCEVCKKQYSEDTRFELHHIDGDCKNNQVENYLWCCASCHKKEHYKLNRTKVYEKGIPTIECRIVSIEYCGMEMVYDIEMQDPAHNFISDSGLVTCNSHSYSVAGDSLYGAYLKSHYPLQFYETFLNILEDDGDKDRLSEVKIEAEEAYGVRFPPLRYGQDNRKIIANVNNNEINQSLKILKGFGDSVGQKFYELSQQFQGSDFLDLLIYAEENGFLSSKWDTLIKINFFEKFGHNKKLYTIYKKFTEGENKYQKTYVEKTKSKRLEELKKIWYDLPNERIPFLEQLENEFLLLGSIQSIYPNINGKYAYVLDVDTKYAPRIQVYGLKRGKQTSLKIYRSTFASKEFDRGAILFCSSLEQKNPIKMVDGKYLEDTNGDPQWWLMNYYIVKPEEFDKILQEK